MLGVEEKIVDTEMRFGGFIDLIARIAGQIEVWDHKFTTKWMAKLETQHRRSMQIPLYCRLVERLVGEPVRIGRINGVLMKDNASNASSKAEKFNRFGADPAQPLFTEYQLERAESWIGEVESAIESDETFPMNPGDSCKWCEFEPVCFARTSAIAEGMLATLYHIEPYKSRLEEEG